MTVQFCLEIAVSRLAPIVGINNYGIEISKVADLILLERSLSKHSY